MMTADQIIDGCGGTSKLAASLDLTPSTVSSWRDANHIPRWWHAEVMKAAKREKFAVAREDFPKRENRTKSARAA